MIDIEKAAAIRAARASRIKTATQKTTKPSAPDGAKGAKTLSKSTDKSKRKPGKTDGAGVAAGGKFTSRSGSKSVAATTPKTTTVKSSANKQPGGRTPKGAGAATAPTGTARKGHRIEAARKSRAATRHHSHA